MKKYNYPKIHKKHYDKNKSLGLCVDCGEKNNGTSLRCDSCNQKMGYAQKDLRLRRSLERVCTRCGNSNICNPYKIQTLSQTGKQNSEVLCIKCYLKKSATRFLGSSSRWQELLELFNNQQGRCVYSGEPIEIGKTASLDHIVPCMGGNNRERITTIENLQWVSLRINYMKRELSEDEFLNLCQKVSTFRK